MTRRAYPKPVTLGAPFPYFGGKSRASHLVWERLGQVDRYIEPFAGSLAVLLARPRPFGGREIVNDSDGLLVNAWRAMATDPEAVAAWADWPATENDLHARHAWLVGHREDITRSLEGDPDWSDPKAAGWWLWGISLWIGGGWCSGKGPWRVVDGQLLHAGDDGRGIHRKLLHAGDDGQGIHRQLLHAGSDGRGIHRKRPPTTGHSPMHGVHSDAIRGNLSAVFGQLAERLRGALVMCGDWSRVVTPAVMFGGRSGATGVFLDPPYPDDVREGDLYAHDGGALNVAVRDWALANGNDPRLRIAVCGYEGQWEMPGWTEIGWTTKGGYASQGDGSKRSVANRRRERIWFSPHCHATGLWDMAS